MVRIKPPAKRLTQTERLQRSWNDASLNLHIEEVGDLREELELNQKPTKKQRKSAVIKDSLTPTLPVFLSGKLPEGSDICLVKFSIEIADGNDSESVEKVFEAAISGALSDAALILPESPLSAGHLMLFTTNNSGETSLLHCLSAFDSKNLFDALRQNKAWVVGMGEIDSARLQLNFNVSIRPSGFVTLNFPAEILGSRMNFNFQSLLDLFSSQISSSIGQIYSPHKSQFIFSAHLFFLS